MRLYDHLFTLENPESDGEVFIENMNPDSLLTLQNCKAEPGLESAETEISYQFLRNGYFCMDSDSKPDQLIFNRTVGLRDNWKKKQK